MLRRPVGLLILLVAGEAGASVGRNSSVAIGADGLALISYADATNRTLKVAHCSNPACTSATLTTLDPGGGPTSVAIGADGLGLIVHASGAGLRAAHCSNLECTQATMATVVFTPFQGGLGLLPGGTLAIGSDGLGTFSYTVTPSPRFGPPYLQAAHCSNLDCSTATFSTALAVAPMLGGPAPHGGGIAIGGDGLPLIAYDAFGGLPPFAYFTGVIHCADVLCSSRTLSSFGPGRVGGSAAIGSDGRGLFPWHPSGAQALQVEHCADVACSSSGSAAPDLNALATDAAIARGADGLGLLAYVVDNDLKVAHCSDLPCASATITLLDGAAAVEDAHLAIGADGLGLISYNDVAAGDLKVAHCENVECTIATVSVVDDGPVSADLVMVLTHSPEPVPGLTTLSYNVRTVNLGPSLAANVSVVHNLPAGVVFQSAVGPGWSCAEASGVVTCTRAGLGPGVSDITVNVTVPNQQATLVSTATVSSDTIDPAPANNTDADQATVTESPVANLAITKSDGGVVGRWGQPFTWTITASNAGPAAALARVVDAFPAGVAGASWTCTPAGGASCPASGSGNLDTLVTLPTGGSVTFTATGTLTPFTFGLTNSATVSPPAGTHDPAIANNTATVISPVEPTQAHTIAPCRVVDTRAIPPALGANTTREFAVGGTCGVPADARAVAVIATVVNPGDLGNLRLYPAGTPMPLASMLNFAAGRTRANNAIVPLGQGGQVSVRCDMPPGSTAATDFLVDVTAYFK
jgi:hypothetical protein